MSYPERPECDFTVPSRIIAFTQCGHCSRTIPQSLAITFRGEHYCDANCAEQDSDLLKLRKAGL